MGGLTVERQRGEIPRVSVEKINTLIVGGGQAGLAMSEHLSHHGVPHLVLERHRIAERWRSERWDSLVTNGPAWHDRFPGMTFPAAGPDSFVPKEEVADYFVDYAKMIKAPIRCGVEAKTVQKLAGRPGFRVETSAGVIEATNVVAATGSFQTPVIPAVIPASADVMQIHSSAYRNPAQLPEGAVLVVGAGSSGVQMAAELLAAGKRVYLSVGPHDRPPRAYRARDYVWWLGVLGKWDIETSGPSTEHVSIAVSGVDGGQTVDFRRLAAAGIVLVGLTQAYSHGTVRFAGDLADNLARGDANYLSLLDEADAYVARNGLDLPEEPEARKMWPDPACLINPIRELHLPDAGVTSVIWATGYALDYSWLELDIFDAGGRPKHWRGVSIEPGIYFLGMPRQTGRGSSFIWGVWHDARYLADRIVAQGNYLAYAPE